MTGRRGSAPSVGLEHGRTRLRGVTDLVGGGESRAEMALGASAGPDAWTDITNTMDGLIAAAPNSVYRPPLDSGVAANDGPDELEAELGGVEHSLPMQDKGKAPPTDFLGVHDVSLKTHVHVVSGNSLSWTSTLPQSFTYAAVQTCWRPPAHSDPSIPAWVTDKHESSSGNVDEDAKFLFAQALLHFRHPAVPLMSVVSSQWQTLFSVRATGFRTLGGSNEKASEVQVAALRRLEDWQNAFRSLFYGFRHLEVPSFYLLLSTTVVLFRNSAKSEAKSEHEPDALISQATPGLLSLLTEYFIPFTQVAEASVAGKENGIGDSSRSDALDGVAREEKAVLVDSARSLPKVSVQGSVNVHALFNFLLQVGPRLGNAVDVPLIISDSPFLGGEISSAEVRSCKETRTATGKTRHDVHLDGFLTQTQFSRLTEAIHKSQVGDYTIIVESEHRSQNLNYSSKNVVSRVASKRYAERPRVYARDIQ